eukprot:5323183-Prymnesium_polylepis.1
MRVGSCSWSTCNTSGTEKKPRDGYQTRTHPLAKQKSWWSLKVPSGFPPALMRHVSCRRNRCGAGAVVTAGRRSND